MPSGSSRRSRRAWSNGRPVARATSTPRTSEPVLYIQRAPGWCTSGRVPSRRIHSSGPGTPTGAGGPWPSSRSARASASGTVPGGAMTMPMPIVKVRRSRTRMGRSAGTTHPRGASSCSRTVRPASSGRRRSTGSSRRKRPSSTQLSATTAVMGLVMEEMRKSASRPRGRVPSRSAWPSTSAWTSPSWATSQIAPGTAPASTWRATARWIRSTPGAWSALDPMPVGPTGGRELIAARRTPLGPCRLSQGGVTLGFETQVVGTGDRRRRGWGSRSRRADEHPSRGASRGHARCERGGR